jgi:hypothetical protein
MYGSSAHCSEFHLQSLVIASVVDRCARSARAVERVVLALCFRASQLPPASFIRQQASTDACETSFP